MNNDEILMKAQNGEGLTVEEIKVYQSVSKYCKTDKTRLRQIRYACQNLFARA